jgi:hypothetical protein
MKHICISLASVCVLCFTELQAQQTSYKGNEYIENLAEEISAGAEIQVDYTTLLEDLHYYYENPLNLNMAGSEELKRLYILNDFQIRCLLDYIRENGAMLTLSELNYVYGFSQKEVKLLMPFVTVKPAMAGETVMFKNALKHGRHEIIFRTQEVIEKQRGYKTISDSILAVDPDKSRYLGSPQKIYSRYVFHSGDRIYAGITAEKDAGEEMFRGNNKHGPDFYSAHIQLNDIGILKRIHLGDYHLRFGQGLTLWSGLAFGKTSYVLNIKKRSEEIRRYTSAEENNFFRGMAATVSAGSFRITPFISYKKRDANITDTLDTGFYEFSSFQNTGYHRTPSENYDEKSVTESVFGANVTWKKKYLQIGATLAHYTFGGKLKESEKVYNRFDFSGTKITNAGVDYQALAGKISLFGETAFGNNGWGLIHGAVFYVNNNVSFSTFYRLYQKDFYTHYGNALAENPYNANENGFYFGVETTPLKYWKISAYTDMYKFPWLKYNASAPSVGSDYLLQVDYLPDRNFEMYLRVKYKNEYENDVPEDTSLTKLARIKNYNVKLNISYLVNKNIILRNRLELSGAEKESGYSDNGYLLYQDIIFKINRLPLDIYFRYAIFDCDSYNSRIYAYENDLLYSYSTPSFFNRGMRTYIMLKYTIPAGADLWLKYGRTDYTNISTISSGLSEIRGNTKSEIKFQVRVKF